MTPIADLLPETNIGLDVEQVATATDAIGIHRVFSTWAPAPR